MTNIIPIPVKRALRHLGENLKNARKRRRVSTALMAERASMSRATLLKIEQGDGSVSMENFAKVIFVLGLHEDLGKLGELSEDYVGLMLADDQLPKRIRYKKEKQFNI